MKPFTGTFETLTHRPQTHAFALEPPGPKLTDQSHTKSSSSRQQQTFDESLIQRKKEELETLKKEETQKLGKFFASISMAARKMVLPRVTAALFGESAYEIEILKHVQQYKASHPKVNG